MFFFLTIMQNKPEIAKNPSVNRDTSKINFFTIDFTTSFPKVYLGRTTFDRWIFYLIQTFFYIVLIRKGNLVFGIFGLGYKNLAAHCEQVFCFEWHNIFGGGCVCGGNFCYHSSMDDCFRPQLFIPCRRLTELLKLNASGLYTLFTIFKYYYCDLLLLCQTSGKTTKSN